VSSSPADPMVGHSWSSVVNQNNSTGIVVELLLLLPSGSKSSSTPTGKGQNRSKAAVAGMCASSAAALEAAAGSS
jgi:hypothetical protein